MKRLVQKKQALRFVHPMYEEAIGELIQKDISSLNVFMICFKSLVTSVVPAYVLLTQMIKKRQKLLNKYVRILIFLKLKLQKLIG